MSGRPVIVQDKMETVFTAWDGHIEGGNLEPVKEERILPPRIRSHHPACLISKNITNRRQQ
jgi:hypothetical protein